MTMPQSKYVHFSSGSDESLAFLLFSNQSVYPGANCEATMLQEALAVTNSPPAEKKPNYFLTIGLEILLSFLLIGVGLLFQLGSKTDVAIPNSTEEKIDNTHNTAILKTISH